MAFLGVALLNQKKKLLLSVFYADRVQDLKGTSPFPERAAQGPSHLPHTPLYYSLLEEGTATHSSIPAWRIPWSLVGYGPESRKESDTTEQVLHTRSPGLTKFQS